MTDVVVYDQESESWCVWLRSGTGRVMLCQNRAEAERMCEPIDPAQILFPTAYFPEAFGITIE